jgi:YHS domain-containing protein
MTFPRLRHRRLAAGASFVLTILCTGTRELTVRAFEPDPIPWRENYGTALDEARAANRLLWIQFTGPWCPNCTRMERDSFPDPAVLQHARDSFVPLKLRSDFHEELALSFNLSGLPATIIVTPNREVVAIHQGYLGPAEFDAFLRDSLSRRAGKPTNSSRVTQKSGAPGPERQVGGKPKEEEPLALEGYCPVSLVRARKLVRGEAAYTVRHEGRTYRFATLVFSEQFRQEPDRFVPGNDGSCPVTELDRRQEKPGDPKWGVLYGGRLYLCASELDRRRFLEEPERYALVAVAEQGFCVHCIREAGLMVRGDPRLEVTRAGKRYWFPDDSHRDAFLASLR